MGVYDIARIQELLVAVIDAVDFPGKQELLAQVPYVRVSGGPITFLELVVDHAAVAPSPFQRGHRPTHDVCLQKADIKVRRAMLDIFGPFHLRTWHPSA